MRAETWKGLLVGLVIVAVAAYLLRHDLDDLVAGESGRFYCHHVQRCDSRHDYDACIARVAEAALHGRPVGADCPACLRTSGCRGLRSCRACDTSN